MDDLLGAGQSCPVDLDGAMSAAGLAADGPVDASVERNEGESDVGELGPMDEAEYVLGECTAPVGDGELAVLVLATPLPSAFNLLIPRIANDLELSSDEIQPEVQRVADADEGELVDLDGEAPAAAVRLHSDGDGSAMLYVAARDTGRPSAAQVHAVAEDVLDDL